MKVITVKLPPLRERRQDIPILANHFLSVYAKSLRKTVQGFTKEASDYFNHYPWPGNVRELEHAVERCVVLAEPDSKTIDVELLPEEITTSPIKPGMALENNPDLSGAVESLERKMVVNALKKFKGNRTKAAENLGLSRRGLLNKIERYELEV